MNDVVIGIDLGTTNTCAAYYINGNVKILENNQGDRITPSFVFYTEDCDCIVGKYAKQMAVAKPEWGVCEIKRLVGRKYDDSYVQHDLKYLPFEVDNDEGNPVILFRNKSGILQKSLQELCALILEQVKTDVENKLGHPVDKAVITVPAYFNISQREVTLAAANQAGLTVLKLFNEPTAAALSHHFETYRDIKIYALVYDLGCQTCKVSILKKYRNKIKVKSTNRDSHLGGQNLNKLIYDYVCNVLISKHGDNPNTDKRKMQRLCNECEKAKIRLSDHEETVIFLEGFLRGDECIDISLTRKQFEEMADELFNTTIEMVEECLQSCNLQKTAIKEIILLGGCSRIPKIQVMLSDYFNGRQLKLLNQPKTDDLSYYFETHSETENYSLVYDLGGGTFDVSIIKKTGNNIDILGVDGDSHLGGHDLDNLIYDYVCDELTTKYGDDSSSDKRKMRRLRSQCEDAKKILSDIEETIIYLEGLLNNHDCIEISLSRKQFEEMANGLFQKTIDIVDRCLKSCNLPKAAIDEIILSGGSTRIPKIQDMLSEYFDGKILNRFVNPDECVAEGAALQAAMLSDNPQQQIDKIRIMDVTSLSLGLSDSVNLMNFVIKRNTPLPASQSVTYCTVCDQQESLQFMVYEGERLDVRKNHYLGTITISDITPAPPGECEVTCTMSVDQNGILTVEAKEKNSDNVRDLKIVYARGSRSDGEIKDALMDEEANKQEDERFKRFANCKRYLLDYCERVLYNFKQKNLIELNQNIYEMCEEMEATVENMEVDDEVQLNEIIEEIKRHCEPIVEEYKFQFMPIYDI